MKLLECYKEVIRNLLNREKSDREFIEKSLEILEKHWNDKNIFIIEAPPGYGKSSISSTIALYSLKNPKNMKCIITFPLKTLLEEQYGKLLGKDSEKGLLGEYKEKQKFIGKRYMYNPDSRYLIKPVTLTTVDTLSLTLFGIPPESIEKVVKEWDGTIKGSLGHYLFSWASVVLSNLILDEVHLLSDSTKSLGFLLALMKVAVDFDQKLILMSATIPDSFRNILKEYSEILDISERVCFINFSPTENSDPNWTEYSLYDEKFVRERLEKKYSIRLEELREEEKFDKIFRWIIEEEKYKRVIAIFNTAKDAIEFYERYQEELKRKFNSNVLLLHSRFSEEDKENIKELLRKFNKEEKYLIISTQSIEAGVDISSDFFITELSPANSLIQRLGRFLRGSEREGKIVIWYEVDENGELLKNNNLYKVYSYEITEKTLEWLKENSEKLSVHVPYGNGEKIGYKELLNYVYDEEFYEINEEHIVSFCSIFLHLENASLVAIEKFFDMEGSFIRESCIVPVIPEEFQKHLLEGEEEISQKIRKYVIPISFNLLRSQRGKILGKIYEEDGKLCFDDKVYNLENPRTFLKELIRKNIIAIVLRGFSYDREIGLRRCEE